MIKKKIKSELNLTYLNHSLFKKVKKIIYNSNLGTVLNYSIEWRIVSYDFNKKKISWKIDETKGGGLKNIFLTHIFGGGVLAAANRTFHEPLVYRHLLYFRQST